MKIVRHYQAHILHLSKLSFATVIVHKMSIAYKSFISLWPWKSEKIMCWTEKNSDGSNTILSNIEWTQTSFYEYQTNSNGDRTRRPYFWLLTIEHRNFEPNMAFTRFTKLLFKLTRASLFRTLNELERVHLLVIKPKNPIFGFERSNIELRTLFDPSLVLKFC